MEPKDLMPVVGQYGLPLVLLAIIVWKGWPFIERRVEHSEKLVRDMFEANQIRWVEVSKEFVQTVQQERLLMEKMLREIEDINREIRKK